MSKMVESCEIYDKIDDSIKKQIQEAIKLPKFNSIRFVVFREATLSLEICSRANNVLFKTIKKKNNSNIRRTPI